MSEFSAGHTDAFYIRGDAPEVWLIRLFVQEDGQHHAVGIKWDRGAQQFIFVGNESEVHPAVHAYFCMIAEKATAWLIELVHDNARPD